MVGVAASAGGVEALRQFAAALPADFPAAVLVVLHIAPTGPTLLPQILDRAGRLPARHPQDGEPLVPGVILVAPPGQHLTVADGHVRLLSRPLERGHRPSADMLLRSVAQDFGPAGSGVVLSGTMDDGAAGLAAVRRAGGLALVQDPGDALFPGMPRAAIQAADPQFIGTVPALAGRLCRWLGELDRAAAGTAGTVSAGQPPAAVTGPGGGDAALSRRPGAGGAPGSGPELTPLTCSECGGSLWLHDEYGVPRLRCRVGHIFSVDGLYLDKQTALERALWAAVVALEERAHLSGRIASRLEATGRNTGAEHFRTDIATAQAQAQLLRGVISDLTGSGSPTHHDGETDVGSG